MNDTDIVSQDAKSNSIVIYRRPTLSFTEKIDFSLFFLAYKNKVTTYLYSSRLNILITSTVDMSDIEALVMLVYLHVWLTDLDEIMFLLSKNKLPIFLWPDILSILLFFCSINEEEC